MNFRVKFMKNRQNSYRFNSIFYIFFHERLIKINFDWGVQEIKIDFHKRLRGHNTFYVLTGGDPSRTISSWGSNNVHVNTALLQYEKSPVQIIN